MLVTPTAIKGPEVTIANYSFGSAYPPGILVGWSSVPNATSYRIYRMLSATQPGVLRGTISAASAAQIGSGGLAAVDPEVTEDLRNFQYWVQAVFADGKTSDPGPVTPTTVQNYMNTNPYPPGLAATVGGTTTLFVGGQEMRGSKVTWTWDATTVPVYLYFATIELAPPSDRLNWTLYRSETIARPGTSPIPYLTTGGVAGPPYTMNLAAGMMVRFCVAAFPISEVQRQNNIGCVTSTLPP
jgi:hypothetical protein